MFMFWIEVLLLLLKLRHQKKLGLGINYVPVDNFKIFGCLVYAHILDEKRQKLDDKGVKCIFLEASEESNYLKHQQLQSSSEGPSSSSSNIQNEGQLINPSNLRSQHIR